MNIGVLTTFERPVLMRCSTCGQEDVHLVAEYAPSAPGTAYSAVQASTRWQGCRFCGAKWVTMSAPPWVTRDLAKKNETDWAKMNLKALADEKKRREEEEAISGPPPVIVLTEEEQ